MPNRWGAAGKQPDLMSTPMYSVSSEYFSASLKSHILDRDAVEQSEMMEPTSASTAKPGHCREHHKTIS